MKVFMHKETGELAVLGYNRRTRMTAVFMSIKYIFRKRKMEKFIYLGDL